jgi:hypothetical protein
MTKTLHQNITLSLMAKKRRRKRLQKKLKQRPKRLTQSKLQVKTPQSL